MFFVRASGDFFSPERQKREKAKDYFAALHFESSEEDGGQRKNSLLSFISPRCFFVRAGARKKRQRERSRGWSRFLGRGRLAKERSL